MRDLRRRLERLEAAELDDGYQIIVRGLRMTKSPYLGGGFSCAGGNTVNHLEKRLQRLEQVLPRWPASGEAAKHRCLARVHLRIGEALGKTDDPLVVKARATLIDDTPEQREQDLEALQQWARAHPELSGGSRGARDRISTRLDELARRMETQSHLDTGVSAVSEGGYA